MKDRILLWNDDNHEPCVWINNKFAGADLETIIESALYVHPVGEEESCEMLYLYFDNFEGLDEGEDEILFDWFQSMPNFTEEQWDLIFKQEWRKLGKTL